MNRIIKNLCGRYQVAFYPVYAAIAGGSIKAGLWLSRAIFLSSKFEPSHDGWFFHTFKQWERELFLTRYEVESARAIWRKLGVLKERSIGMPQKLWFWIDTDKLAELVEAYEFPPDEPDELQS